MTKAWEAPLRGGSKQGKQPMIGPGIPPRRFAPQTEHCEAGVDATAHLKRPSVMSAHSLPRPAPMMAEVGVSISGMPGPPLGPSYRMTTTEP